MTNPTDAREAFIEEVFGEIVKVEKSVKETAAQVRSMVVELRQSESAISVSTSNLIAAANKLAQGNALVSDKAKDELKWAIDRIETGTANLARAVEPLTNLTLGLRDVARVEAKKQTFDFLEKKEKKLDYILAAMDVFLQQIDIASERLPQLAIPPCNVSQVNNANVKYIKNGRDMRTLKRRLQIRLGEWLKS